MNLENSRTAKFEDTDIIFLRDTKFTDYICHLKNFFDSMCPLSGQFITAGDPIEITDIGEITFNVINDMMFELRHQLSIITDTFHHA